jgi:two-component system, LytTR family, response regulator
MPDRKRISVIIADDEALARERLRQVLGQDSEIEIVAECGGGAETVEAVTRIKPDLLFLDIQMPAMDGFAVTKKITSPSMPLIIFVTAFDEYAVQAFELHACDYILKPFKKKRFLDTLAHAKSQLGLRANAQYPERITNLLESWKRPQLERISIKEQERIFFIKVTDVDWFEAEDNYVRIHSAGTSYLTRQTMRALEEQLDPRRFVRIHRTAIVNVEKIRELQQWFQRDYRVVLHDGTKIPLGRSYRQHLRSVLGLPL